MAVIEALCSTHGLDLVEVHVRTVALPGVRLEAATRADGGPVANMTTLAWGAVTAKSAVVGDSGTVAAPLRETAGAEPFGAVCLRRADGDRDALRDLATTLAEDVAASYLTSLAATIAELRQRLSLEVGFRRDLHDLASNAAGVLAEAIAVDSLALWTFDPSRRHLTLQHGASSDADSVMTISLPLPAGTRLGGQRLEAIGVIELVDHRYIPLSWRDERVARALANTLAPFVFHLACAGQQELSYARLRHGIQSGLQAARATLWSLDHVLPVAGLPQGHRGSLPMAISLIEDISLRFDREDLVGRSELVLRPVRVHTEVLAGLGAMAYRMGMSRGGSVPRLVIEPRQMRPSEVPPVLGDSAALAYVLRSLLDNTIKYSGNHEPEVRLKLDCDERSVSIVVTDDGVGIPPDEFCDIFAEGFRGRRAHANHPAGLGCGLHDCMVLMRRMNGDISVLPSTRGAAFRLVLPRAQATPGNSKA
jgi:signal transduction histidine kinase